MHNSSNIALTDASIIEAYPLVAQPSSETKIYLGTQSTDSFLLVDYHWKPLAEILKTPKSIENIIKALKKADPDFFSSQNADFKTKILLLLLVQHNLIKRVDGRAVFGHTKQRPTGPFESRFKFLLTPPLLFIYALLLLPAILGLLLRPDLWPVHHDFFWHPRFSVAFLSMFVVSWFLAVGHELAHYLTAAAFGVKGHFSISNRLSFLVLETEYPNIYGIERWKRTSVYLAGLIFDLVIIGFIHTLLILPTDMPVTLILFLKQVLLIQWLGVLWQFLLYMRTDIYFVVREFFEVENLFTHAQQKLASFLWPKRYRNQLYLNARQMRLTNLYAGFYAVGLGLALWRYGVYFLPIMVELWLGSLRSIGEGLASGSFIDVADGTIVLTIELFTLVLLFYSLWKRRTEDFAVFKLLK